MAMGWLTVLKLVPWGDVIENAPKVASGAKKLWNSVSKKPAPVLAPGDASQAAATGAHAGQQDTVAALAAQVAALQVATADLQQQMVDSSALIRSLAEQNTQLIERLDATRKRLAALVAVVLLTVVAVSVPYFR
jgi:hypothetical protein